ncbi:MAG: antibiotic biosynthesis monooxygenase [Gemmatimonadetes bacterium]|nr:antibiotic biosynthesis monooxygenase [Gemmatimonadota bacterium]
MRSTMTRALLAAALLGGTGPLAAQDPVPLYPDNYRVLVENPRVRVLDFQLRRGHREAMHRHPAHVLYVLTGFRIRFTLPDGTTRIRETRAGDVPATRLRRRTWRDHAPAEPGTPPRPLPHSFRLPGQGDSLEAHLRSLSAPTRAEPGALRYDLYRSVEHPDDFLRHEVWQDAAALEAHKQSPPLRASFARRQREGWRTEITLWQRVSP